jgi:hypothetical protein
MSINQRDPLGHLEQFTPFWDVPSSIVESPSLLLRLVFVRILQAATTAATATATTTATATATATAATTLALCLLLIVIERKYNKIIINILQ